MSEKEVLVPNIGDFKDVEVIEVLIEAGSNRSQAHTQVVLKKLI